MNLKELKSMIAEEYSNFMAEQYTEQAAPGVAVDAGDVNAMGGDSEATLRQIYDMLKDYFEGEAGAAGAAPAAPAGDMDAMEPDMDAMDDDDMAAADAADDDDMSEEKDDDDDDKKKDKKEGKKDKEELKERFQKLANIVKG